ncbi:E3 ubiquitin-protein ligase TTC3 [Ctenodactylus gundi]
MDDFNERDFPVADYDCPCEDDSVLSPYVRVTQLYCDGVKFHICSVWCSKPVSVLREYCDTIKIYVFWPILFQRRNSSLTARLHPCVDPSSREISLQRLQVIELMEDILDLVKKVANDSFLIEGLLRIGYKIENKILAMEEALNWIKYTGDVTILSKLGSIDHCWPMLSIFFTEYKYHITKVVTENCNLLEEFKTQNCTGCIEQGELMKMKGNEEFSKERYDIAIIFYTRAIEYRPDNHFLYGNRALCFLRTGRFRNALGDGKRATILKSSWPKGHYRYCTALSKLGEYDWALQANIKAQKLCRNDPDGIKDLIHQHVKLQKQIEDLQGRTPSKNPLKAFYESRSDWEKLLEREFSKSSRAAQQDFANIMKTLRSLIQDGYTALLDQRCRSAAHSFTELLSGLDPQKIKQLNLAMINYVLVVYGLAISLLGIGKPEELSEAENQFKRIIELYPSEGLDCLAYCGIGKIYLKKNRFLEALNHFEKAKTLIYRLPGVLTWPTSNVVIEESQPETIKGILETFVEECKFPPVPDAVCCYQKCLGFSKIQIYVTDPDYKGFIRISCCQCCKIEFHMNCWKKLKTTTFNDKIDKDFLQGICLTPDCQGTISKIVIFSSAGKVKCEFEHKVIKEKVPPRPILKQKCTSLEKLKQKEDKKLKRKLQKQEAKKLAQEKMEEDLRVKNAAKKEEKKETVSSVQTCQFLHDRILQCLKQYSDKIKAGLKDTSKLLKELLLWKVIEVEDYAMCFSGTSLTKESVDLLINRLIQKNDRVKTRIFLHVLSEQKDMEPEAATLIQKLDGFGLDATETFYSRFGDSLKDIDFSILAFLWKEKYNSQLPSIEGKELAYFREPTSLKEARFLIWLLDDHRDKFPHLHSALDEFFNVMDSRCTVLKKQVKDDLQVHTKTRHKGKKKKIKETKPILVGSGTTSVIPAEIMALADEYDPSTTCSCVAVATEVRTVFPVADVLSRRPLRAFLRKKTVFLKPLLLRCPHLVVIDDCITLKKVALRLRKKRKKKLLQARMEEHLKARESSAKGGPPPDPAGGESKPDVTSELASGASSAPAPEAMMPEPASPGSPQPDWEAVVPELESAASAQPAWEAVMPELESAASAQPDWEAVMPELESAASAQPDWEAVMPELESAASAQPDWEAVMPELESAASAQPDWEAVMPELESAASAQPDWEAVKPELESAASAQPDWEAVVPEPGSPGSPQPDWEAVMAELESAASAQPDWEAVVPEPGSAGCPQPDWEAVRPKLVPDASFSPVSEDMAPQRVSSDFPKVVSENAGSKQGFSPALPLPQAMKPACWAPSCLVTGYCTYLPCQGVGMSQTPPLYINVLPGLPRYTSIFPPLISISEYQLKRPIPVASCSVAKDRAQKNASLYFKNHNLNAENAGGNQTASEREILEDSLGTSAQSQSSSCDTDAALGESDRKEGCLGNSDSEWDVSPQSADAAADAPRTQMAAVQVSWNVVHKEVNTDPYYPFELKQGDISQIEKDHQQLVQQLQKACENFERLKRQRAKEIKVLEEKLKKNLEENKISEKELDWFLQDLEREVEEWEKEKIRVDNRVVIVRRNIQKVYYNLEKTSYTREKTKLEINVKESKKEYKVTHERAVAAEVSVLENWKESGVFILQTKVSQAEAYLKRLKLSSRGSTSASICTSTGICTNICTGTSSSSCTCPGTSTYTSTSTGTCTGASAYTGTCTSPDSCRVTGTCTDIATCTCTCTGTCLGTGAYTGRPEQRRKANQKQPVPQGRAPGSSQSPKKLFDNITEQLSATFPCYSSSELAGFVKKVRSKNKNSLSGLSTGEIVQRVTEHIRDEEKKKKPNPGKDKRTSEASDAASVTRSSRSPPSGAAGPSNPTKGQKTKGFSAPHVKSCELCHETFKSKNIRVLICGHKFHKGCFKQCLKGQKTCPACCRNDPAGNSPP